MPIEWVMLSNHLVICLPFLLLPQSFPESGSFPMGQPFASGSQSTGDLAPVLPKNIQFLFPLGLIGLISLQSKGLSRVFSNTTIRKINSSALSLLYCPTVTFVPDYQIKGASLVAQIVKNLPATQETQVQPLGWEDPLEEGRATHSSILAWRIPWTEEPGRLQSMGSQRVRHD